METAAIYVRRSALDDREGDNRSLGAQERECRAWAEREGLEVGPVYREAVGTSASRFSKKGRPQMERALAEMGTNFKTLIVWAFDRATRLVIEEVGDILNVVEATGGRMVSVTDGVDTDKLEMGDRLSMILRAEFAREESEGMGKRIRRGKEEQRKRGEYLGGSVGYGHAIKRVEGQTTEVVVDEEAAAVIREMAKLILDGASLRETCDAINDAGHRTAGGVRWSAQTLSQMLRQPRMIGHRRYGDDVYRDEDGEPIKVTPEILDEATFRRVDKVLRTRNWAQTGPRKVNGGQQAGVLAGLVTCGECRTPMVRSSARVPGKEGEYTYRYYLCPVCNPNHGVYYAEVNDHVARTALLHLAAQEPESAILDEVGRRGAARQRPEQVGRRREIDGEVEILEGRLATLRRDYYQHGRMDEDEFGSMEHALTLRVQGLRDERDAMPAPDNRLLLGAILDLAQSNDEGMDPVGPGSAWAALPAYEQRDIMTTLVDTVVVDRRPKPSVDIVGRVTITLATESNVTELAVRTGRAGGRHTKVPKVA